MRNAKQQFATDYRWWDNAECVTFRGDESREIAYAKRDDTKRGDRVPFASEAIPGDLVDWHIPDQLLGGLQPKIGDRLYVGYEAEIRSDTELRIVHEAMTARFGTEWILKATRFGSSFLRHTVDVLEQRMTRDEDTAAVIESFTTIATDVPCWVRPATAQESIAWFQEGSVAGHLVYFDADPQVDTQHVLLWRDRHLAVKGYARNVDGFDSLWIVPCLG